MVVILEKLNAGRVRELDKTYRRLSYLISGNTWSGFFNTKKCEKRKALKDKVIKSMTRHINKIYKSNGFQNWKVIIYGDDKYLALGTFAEIYEL